MQQPDYIIIGQISRPHGVKGAVKVISMTDYPDRFKVLEHVFLHFENKESRTSFHVESVQYANKHIILKLDSITSREMAEEWRNALLEIPRDNVVELPDDGFYYFEVIGFKAVLADGSEKGIITDVMETAAHDIFVITKDDQEFLVPAVDEFIGDIDKENQTIAIKAIDGLFE